MKIKIIHLINSKGKNYRVNISLVEDEKQDKFFIVRTKRLKDFKSRAITTTDNIYSIETFAVLSYTSNFFMEHPEIQNKILLNELHKINKAKTTTTLNTE